MKSIPAVLQALAGCGLVAGVSLSSAVAKVYHNEVIPQPAKMDRLDTGDVLLPKTITITAPGELANEKKALSEALGRLGIRVAGKGALNVQLAIDKQLAPEAYALTVDRKAGIRIRGGSSAGVFYGVQTLKQFMPDEVWERGKSAPAPEFGEIHIPAVNIEDAPLAEWRGMMMDSARHFMPKEFMLKLVDMMAMHKLNRLHWHIVDSEGWRMEIKKYPKLHMATQAFPAEYPSEDPTDPSRPAKFMYGHFHGGGFYTQEDIKEIVAYAKSRHIEIIPELGFPAHAMAALTAYPEFSTTRKVPSVRSNISPDLYSVRPDSMQFLKDILDETMELFPYKVIHFGGDEAPKGQWKNCPDAQALMKKEGFTDENQLQAWMFNQLAAHIAKKGRVAAGWEEIMHGKNMETLTKTAIVYPWLSHDNATLSANAGHPVVHCAVGPFYLDSWQTTHPADNWSLYKGPFTLASIYNFNMFPGKLTDAGKKNILGAQGQMWSELTPKPEHVEYQIFPRLCALAELTWTPANRKDYGDFYKRLQDHTRRMDAMGIHYRFVDPSPMAAWTPQALEGPTFGLDTELPAGDLRADEVVVELAYQKGSEGLKVEKVALVIDGKEVAAEARPAFLGTHTPKATWKLNVAKLPKSGKPQAAKVVVTHSNGQARDSFGEAVVFASKKGAALFDVSKYKGGDYPTATWNVAGAREQVRLPMDGIVREPGEYELIAKLTSPDVPVRIGDVVYQGTDGVTGKVAGGINLTRENPVGYLPMSITENDMRAGSSIMCQVSRADGAQPGASLGELRVRRAARVNVTGDTAHWVPDMLTRGNLVVYANGVTAASNGKVTATFKFDRGANGADIQGAQLLDSAGNVVASDNHSGFAGNNPKDNTYTFQSDKIEAGKAYLLRFTIAGAGGSDSHGTVTVK